MLTPYQRISICKTLINTYKSYEKEKIRGVKKQNPRTKNLRPNLSQHTSS
ncbi:hypothetical protein MtrunA17_Chr4g0031361 [Medicago truncatula]|uniref:Uncharacterized protein n=1 Tax=Medicago truncatula TaxID=3880 RepID=A0A396I5P0_MEDTR|nr:hypothetical protein MtrunA17_Chr4g0031361 [Medicago truncatula]